MNSLDTDFHRRLDKRLDAMVAECLGRIATGVLEHPNYKRECGYLRALQDMKDEAAQIEQSMQEGK